MSAFRFFLSYPINNSEYSDFFEITDDVNDNSSSVLRQSLANNDFDVGNIKFSNINLVLDNQRGTYSEAINPVSIFTFKRDQSILKIEWDRNVEPAYCGSSPCGLTFLSEPIEVFRGILQDNNSNFDAETQTQRFTFLGLESIIGRVQVPFSNLSVSDDFNTLIFKMLDQDSIKRFITVDQANINCGLNLVPDSIDSLEDRKILDALNDILLLAGSVLYVKDQTLFVTDRSPSADSQFTFYGPSSDLGIENLHDFSNFTLGQNRTFNFWRFEESAAKGSFQDSIDTFGFRDKALRSEIITTQPKQQQIIDFLLFEFGFPKKEVDLVVPLTSEIIKLFFLDKINIDYPADYRVDADESIQARYGSAVYGSSRYLQAISSLIVSIATDWKILNVAIDIKKLQATLKIREV